MRHPSSRLAKRASAAERPAPRAVAAGPASRPVLRQTLTAATLEAIRERILSGAYGEGEQLRQDAIAAELGVSRIPVREALRQLEVEGLVTFNPHRGAVVSSLSIAEIEELFELRAVIEADLLRRAVPQMSDEDVQRATEVLDAFEAALSRGEVAAWGDINWQLHSTLYAAANRPLTMAIVENLHHHANRYSRMQLALTHGESRANEEHRAIVDAARKRNVDKACRLLSTHILGAGRSLVRFIREQRGSDD